MGEKWKGPSECAIYRINPQTHLRIRTSFCASTSYADLRPYEPQKRSRFQRDFGLCSLRFLLFKSAFTRVFQVNQTESKQGAFVRCSPALGQRKRLPHNHIFDDGKVWPPRSLTNGSIPRVFWSAHEKISCGFRGAVPFIHHCNEKGDDDPVIPRGEYSPRSGRVWPGAFSVPATAHLLPGAS